MNFDLKNPEHAYFIGLAQSDGSLYSSSRNRGRFIIELQQNDIDILQKISKILDCNYSIIERTRNTNFKDNYKSCTLSINNYTFRKSIEKYIPCGKKSNSIVMPKGISKRDYFRGIIDGDGSLGYTSNNFPFVSLVTDSESLALSFIKYIQEVTGKIKTTSRNKRDNVFNIMVSKEDAQMLVKELYYEDCIALNRKLIVAKEVLKWKRPEGLKKINSRKWDKSQDEYILNHTIEESIKALNRTESSIKNRLFRLKHME